MICGTIASKGFAYGQAYILRDQTMQIEPCYITDGEVVEHLKRLDYALRLVSKEMTQLTRQARRILDEDKQQILASYVILLEDPELSLAIEDLIKGKLHHVDYAVYRTFEDHALAMSRLENPYLRERATDYRDLGQRVLQKLRGGHAPVTLPKGKNLILVAEDLSPAQSIQLNLESIHGLIMDLGGETSHTSILARSLNIPAIVGTKNATRRIKNKDWILLDAVNNRVVIDPDALDMEAFSTHQQNEALKDQQLLVLKAKPAATADGHRVVLAANVGSPQEVQRVLQKGAEAVGLFRTEFLFMDRDSMPSEDEQFDAYKEFALALQGRSGIIRTMDCGGDKGLPYLKLPEEANPFLGLRGIRIGLRFPELLLTQLRALLRAAVFGDIKIMFPMVSSVDEIIELRRLVQEAKNQLQARGSECVHEIELGIMVETPAAAAIAEHLIRYVQFFSIGTNDLTQYTLAVDRGNSDIAHLYQGLSPAVLRLIQQAVRAAQNAGKWSGVCGELASQVGPALLLVGMGVDELSMSASSCGALKFMLNQVTYSELQDLSHKALLCETVAEVKTLIDTFLAALQGLA